MMSKRERKHRLLRLIVLLCVVGIGVYFFTHRSSTSKTDGMTQSAASILTTPTEFPLSPTPVHVLGVKSDTLGAEIQSALMGTKGTYGIVVKNLQTQETFYQNEERVFDTASLYKLWIMATVYQQMQYGKLQKNDLLQGDIPMLNKRFNIDPKQAEKNDGKVILTVQDALDKMITISDNYAALLLTAKVGLFNVTQFLQNNGLVQSKIGTATAAPKTTALDMAIFLEKLYNNQLANPEYTTEMLSLLKRQRLNGKIPKYLPDEIFVAHKTGELEPFTHDAGIIFAPTGDYILVVVSESNSRELGNERIATVSKNIYNYFAGIHDNITANSTQDDGDIPTEDDTITDDMVTPTAAPSPSSNE